MSNASAYPPTFIVSTGRCGSTLMSRLVRMHPKILSISEFFMSVATRGFVKKTLDGEQLWKLLSIAHAGEKLVFTPDQLVDEFLYPYGPDARFTPEDLPPLLFVVLPHITDDHEALYAEMEPVIRARPRASLAEQYAFLFGWLRDRMDKDLWIERSGASLTFLPPLKDMYPDAKFIHVYRDGRDVAMSMVRHAPTRLYAHAWHTAGMVGVNPLKRPFLLGETPIVPLFEPVAVKLLGLGKKLHEPLPPADTGAFWSAMIEVGLQNLKGLGPDRLMSMKYEDLVANPRSELERFVGFLGPDLMDEAWLEAASAIPRYKDPAWKDLPADDLAALEKAVAPGMALLGYDL